MFSCHHERIVVRVFKQLKRFWSDGTLIVKNNSQDPVIQVSSCIKSKSRKPKNEDLENIWLKNLSLENLKIYRRTSSGSFRKINVPNFLEKLRVILPDQFECKENVGKTSKETDVKKDLVVASPHMSEFLIQNMVTFPLLRSQCDDSVKHFIKDEEELEMVDIVRYPSVTKILQETLSPESKERLDRWQLRMIEKMGADKFQEYKEDIFNQGSKFHGALKKYLESGEERLVSIDQSIEGCWNSVSRVLEDISNVTMVEESVCHPVLSYKGYVDCVASYRDVPYVIEWKKTSKKVTSISKLYDAPVQACAYMGALSWRKDLARNTPKKCLIVIAYTNGEPADVFPIDLEQCQVYWSNFLHRLQWFWSKRWPDLKLNESHV